MWNVWCLMILFTLLMVLLMIDSPKEFRIKAHPNLLSRQLKSLLSDQFLQENQTLKIDKDKDIPLIYVITPTYYRETQMAEITRLSNTLRQVKRLHWVVVEDWKFTNHYIHEFLKDSNMSFTYMAQPKLAATSNISKGIDQRNAALHWITRNHNWAEPAVVYFADDDNSYDLRIFEEMRYTKKLSMWPVGLSGKMKVEKPIVKNGKVTKFRAWWAHGRVFPIDMAGFAINVNVLWDYHPMRFDTHPKYCCMMETSFLELCCTIDEIEPLADNCTKVYVWHTRTSKPNLTNHVSQYGDIYV